MLDAANCQGVPCGLLLVCLGAEVFSVGLAKVSYMYEDGNSSIVSSLAAS